MITMATRAILTLSATVHLHQPTRTLRAVRTTILTKRINARPATIAIRTHLTLLVLLIIMVAELMEVESLVLFRPFYA